VQLTRLRAGELRRGRPAGSMAVYRKKIVQARNPSGPQIISTLYSHTILKHQSFSAISKIRSCRARSYFINLGGKHYSLWFAAQKAWRLDSRKTIYAFEFFKCSHPLDQQS